MKNALNLPPVIETLTKAYAKYIELSTYLKLYMSEPAAVIKELSECEESELSSVFKDVAQGLRGDFTRSKAIDIGKQAIFNAIVKTKDELVNAYNEALDISKYPTIEVFNTFDVVMNNTDTYSLLTRKDAYTANEVAIEYIYNKLTALSVTLLKEVDAQIEFGDYLNRLNSILSTLTVSRDVNYFDKPYNVFRQASEYSSIMKDAVAKDGYHHVENDFVAYSDIASLNEKEIYLDAIRVTKSKEANANDTLTILNDVVDILPQAIVNIKNDITNYGSSIEKLKNVSTVFLPTITEFGENYLVPFMQSEMTLGTFDTALSNYSNFLETQIADTSNAFAEISNIAYNILRDLKLYMQCYSVVDMMTFTGTVGRYSVNSK